MVLVLAAWGLAACAAEVVRRPSRVTELTGSTGDTIEILADAPVTFDSGYQRVIGRGSVWTKIGRTAEGDVFKPVNRVFTIEGAHIHEAYLVLDGDRVVGFYLPVERAFSPAVDGHITKLSFERRQRP
jgi:hypothetical protein